GTQCRRQNAGFSRDRSSFLYTRTGTGRRYFWRYGRQPPQSDHLCRRLDSQRAPNDNVFAPAFHANGWQRIAAATGFGVGDHSIAEVVANHRLNAVREIGEKHRVRDLAQRGGTITRIDWLEHHPIGVDVKPAFAAAEGDAHAFRRPIFVEDRTVERVLELSVSGRR